MYIDNILTLSFTLILKPYKP